MRSLEVELESRIRTTVDGTSHRREIVQDGQVVSRLSVLERSAWLLGVPVTFGGIGGVWTDSEWRLRGLSRRLMGDSVEYMTRRGYDLSMLFGISDFYNKFGFLPCLPEHLVTIQTRNAERVGAQSKGFSTRPFSDGDVPFCIDLYTQRNRTRSCAVTRSKAVFRGFRRGSGWGKEAEAFMVEDAEGKPVGYFATDKSDCDVKVLEAHATSALAVKALLYALARLAVKRRCGRIEMMLPADHAVTRRAKLLGCVAQTTYSRMGGGMMRILNQDSFLERLRPAMDARLQAGAFAGKALLLILDTNLGQTELRLGPKSKAPERASISLGQNKLTQVVVGYRRALDLVADDDVDVSGPAAEVLEAAFGGQEPHVWRNDHF